MTGNKSQLIKFILFFAGAGIVVLSFFLIRGERELTGTDVFIWTSIGVMYFVFFLPFFFSVINSSNFSRKIPPVSIVWFCIIFYIAASATVIILLARVILPLNIAIIIQSILLFAFLVVVFLSYMASDHVGNVAAEEKSILQYVTEMKSKAQTLSLAVGRLPTEYASAQNAIRQSIDDIRYISPVNGKTDDGAGMDLEIKILDTLNMLLDICGSLRPEQHSVNLGSEAEKLQMFVKERKLLRN